MGELIPSLYENEDLELHRYNHHVSIVGGKIAMLHQNQGMGIPAGFYMTGVNCLQLINQLLDAYTKLKDQEASRGDAE